MSQSSSSYQDKERRSLLTVETSLKAIREKGLQPVAATNTTPKKRDWDFDDRLPPLGDRNAILAEWRQNARSVSRSDNSTATTVKMEFEDTIPPATWPTTKQSPPPLPMSAVHDSKPSNGAPLADRPLNLVDMRSRRRKAAP